MKLRVRKNGELGSGWQFNTHALCEVIMGFDAGDMDSMPCSELDVQLPSGEWKTLSQAFHDHDVVPDNYNRSFAVPRDECARERGWND